MKKTFTLLELILTLVLVAVLFSLSVAKNSYYTTDAYEALLDAVEQRMYSSVAKIDISYKKGENIYLAYEDFSVDREYSCTTEQEGQITSFYFEEVPTYYPGNPSPYYGCSENYTIGDMSNPYQDCEAVFHSLSGIRQLETSDEGFGAHSWDTLTGSVDYYAAQAAATEAGEDIDYFTTRCQFTSPAALGKAQRRYHYYFRENKLVRIS